jgi:putative membrane protein
MSSLTTLGDKLMKDPLLTLSMLAIVYLVGIGGILSPYQDYFLLLTPLNLLLTLILTLRKELLLKTLPFMGFAALAWLVGYGIEVAGVHTGLIFGSYQYGATLGLKIFEVPLMIGVNWLLLTYSAGELVRKMPKMNRFAKALITAAFMVGLDFLIEPVAIRLDFWNWEGGEIPIRNYVAWYIVAGFLAYVYHGLPHRPVNQIAIFTFTLQIAFFLILNLFL